MFKIGEIAIFIPDDEEWIRDCTITRLLEYQCWEDSKGMSGFGYCYTVHHDDEESLAMPHELRKKKPPLSTWEQVQEDTKWNPIEVTYEH